MGDIHIQGTKFGLDHSCGVICPPIWRLWYRRRGFVVGPLSVAPPLGNVGCRGSRGSRNFYGNEAAEWIDDGLSSCTATKSFRTRIGQDNGSGVSINSAN